MKLLIASCLIACVGAANKFAGQIRPGLPLQRPAPPVEQSPFNSIASTAATTDESTGSGFFTQLLDHNDPSKGTFQQRYWWRAKHWAGLGSPIVLFTPGEIAGDTYVGDLYNNSLFGYMAQELKGASFMVEHRFYGDSSPYSYLSTENLTYLTLDQTMRDFVNIARTIDLPFDTNHSSNVPNAPWVWSGGSYGGSLAGWIEAIYPGTFWAYHASSAPAQVIEDYWSYWTPVQQGMPKNCSKDLTLVIDYMDDIFTSGTAEEHHALKAKFGLQDLENADFVSTIAIGPAQWQNDVQFYTSRYHYSAFYEFCDYVEGVEPGASESPGEEGAGLEVALAGYANWFSNLVLPGFCQGSGYDGERDVGCFAYSNASNLMYTDYEVRNPWYRQFFWMLCNEPFAFWQGGAPRNVPTIVSRLLTVDYFQSQCAYWFPPGANGETYGSADPAVTVDRVNAVTQGWNLVNTTRLLWVNGEFDPWRTASVSSEFRPGGPLESTAQHPIFVIPNGTHCSDLYGVNWFSNAGLKVIIGEVVKQIEDWVQEFYDLKSIP